MRATTRLRRLFGRPRVLGTVCAIYALFSVAPHFALVSHHHEGGDRSHHHAFLSAHDVALERAALQALDGVDARGAEPRAEIAARGTADGEGLLPLAPGSEAVAAKREAPHAHYQEDPNLLAQAERPEARAPAFVALPRRDAPPFRIVDRASPEASARAPPRA